jgi:hypothetical protein
MIMDTVFQQLDSKRTQGIHSNSDRQQANTINNQRQANRTKNQSLLLLCGTGNRLRMPLQVHQHALRINHIASRTIAYVFACPGLQALDCLDNLVPKRGLCMDRSKD